MILEEMFNGRFYPCETVVADSPRFKQAVKASAALMDTLSEHLSKEDYTPVSYTHLSSRIPIWARALSRIACNSANVFIFLCTSKDHIGLFL